MSEVHLGSAIKDCIGKNSLYAIEMASNVIMIWASSMVQIYIIYRQTSSILRKGLAVSHCPTARG